MTPEFSNDSETTVDADLDRLAYSAYLLTQDPALAPSVVLTALHGSLEDPSAVSDLLGRTSSSHCSS